jgi:hypothetical protein
MYYSALSLASIYTPIIPYHMVYNPITRIYLTLYISVAEHTLVDLN